MRPDIVEYTQGIPMHIRQYPREKGVGNEIEGGGIKWAPLETKVIVGNLTNGQSPSGYILMPGATRPLWKLGMY